jgi:hypothetical protein
VEVAVISILSSIAFFVAAISMLRVKV